MLKQHEVLKQVFFLLMKSDLFPEASSKELALDVLTLHKNGYLYASSEDDVVRFVACGYRTNKIPKEYPKEYPPESKGKIFYIAWAISKDNDTSVIKRLFTSLFETNDDIETIVFHDLRQDSKLKIFNRKPKKVAKKKVAKKKKKKDKTIITREKPKKEATDGRKKRKQTTVS